MMDNMQLHTNGLSSSDEMEKINYLLKQLTPRARELSLHDLDLIRKSSTFIRATIITDVKTEIVGIATLTHVRKPTAFFGTIEDVVVDKNFRGHGIGSKMILRLLEVATELTMKYVDLSSKPKRIEANKLYIALGAAKRDTNVYRFQF